MDHFRYKDGELYAEDVPLLRLARRYGTPLYVYSRATLLRHLDAYSTAFKGVPHIVCFALKANSNISVLRLLGRHGAGADVVSGGELFRARKAGIPPARIVYAGVGKTREEIAYAIKSKILMFNVESFDELREIDRVAGELGKKAPIALRVNPDVDPQTHPYISTGLKEHKFGIPIKVALEYYGLAKEMRNINVVGIHKHIGSQLTKVSPFVDSLKRVLALVEKLAAQGHKVKYLDMGGGLGITYERERPPHPRELAKKIVPLLKGYGITLILEPGRSIMGNAGLLLTKCLYLKDGPGGKVFVIVDAGMNDLMRPSLYSAFHQVLPVTRRRRKRVLADVVGPICESGDFLAKDREIGLPASGEHLAVMSCGAYGFTMSSNYNSRPRAAEVLVSGKTHKLIRARETYADLVRGEL